MKTFKTIALSLSFLFLALLVNINETKAHKVKKDQNQNKKTTEYKSELVNKIIKAYKLDPKNNPKDQCELMDVLDVIWHDSEDDMLYNHVEQIKKEIGIPNIKYTQSCDKEEKCSINNDVFSKEFPVYQDEVNSDLIVLYFDKYGNPIGYNSAGDPPSNHCDSLEDKGTEFFSLRKKKVEWPGKAFDVVDKNHPDINLITKGAYYVIYYNIK